MTFYGQLDSVGDEVTLADVGMIHVFVCFDCYTTTSVLQSGLGFPWCAAEHAVAVDVLLAFAPNYAAEV